jgi:ABC-type antimicrobial peptide transport system permease subunit
MEWRLWNSSSEATSRSAPFLTSPLTGFYLVALLMAAVGIYGLIQYSIATRTHEIGIRMPVGAEAGKMFRTILGEGLKPSRGGFSSRSFRS